MHDTGEALRHAGVTSGCNPDCFCDGRKCSRLVSLQPVSVCKVGQNPCFIFQSGPS